MVSPLPIGEILLSRGVITEAQLEQVITIQKETGVRLGDIIISQNFASYLQLYGALAEHYDLPFVNLLQHPPDKSLILAQDAENYILSQAIPWQQDDDGKIIIALTELSEDTNTWITRHYGKNVGIVITSPLDIRKTVEREFGTVLEEKSRLQLWQEKPEISARFLIPSKTQKYLYMAAFFAIILGILFPLNSLIVLISFCTFAYSSSMIMKTFIFIKGVQHTTPINWEKELENLDDADLPIYTILIPMYREVASIPKLIASLKNMDYPAEKLDIKLILEEDDTQTYAAAIAQKPSHNFEIIRVPVSALRTKPKACNYALKFARGEYVTVFDADDIPDVLQLKKAIYTFLKSPKNVACLQARLNYYNANYNWLTRFFALEYSLFFDFLLCGLHELDMPLPLGGTSNHLSLAHLRKLGAWDAFNVTEDADLGIRLASLGLHTEMLDSCTMEEAVCTLPAWIRQRSRWIKGYMQTWLVYMREPQKLYKTLGWNGFWGFHFFIGVASFTFLTAPITWIISVLWWRHPEILIFPEWLFWLSFANVAISFITHWFMMIFCLRNNKNLGYKQISAAVFYSFYLLLHSIASYKALYQLIIKPHFWEKTEHGENCLPEKDWKNQHSPP